MKLLKIKIKFLKFNILNQKKKNINDENNFLKT